MHASLALATVAKMAPSGALPKEAWRCTTVLELFGSWTHFWIYGEDSFSGTSELVCRQGIEVVRSKVRVTFNSDVTGFGANASNKIRGVVAVSTTSDPHSLQVLSKVMSSDGSGLIQWHIQTGLTEALIEIRSTHPWMNQSLERGSLFIRGIL